MSPSTDFRKTTGPRLHNPASGRGGIFTQLTARSLADHTERTSVLCVAKFFGKSFSVPPFLGCEVVLWVYILYSWLHFSSADF